MADDAHSESDDDIDPDIASSLLLHAVETGDLRRIERLLRRHDIDVNTECTSADAGLGVEP